MIRLKTILLLAVMLLSANSAFGQASKKMMEKAAEKTEKINQMILAGDADLALTAEQTEQINTVYAKMLAEVKAARKSDEDEESQKAAMKAARKTANQQINKEILTKEQRLAKKAGKAKKD